MFKTVVTVYRCSGAADLLPAIITAVGMAAAMAFGDGVSHWTSALAVLWVAVMWHLAVAFTGISRRLSSGKAPSGQVSLWPVPGGDSVSPKNLRGLGIWAVMFSVPAWLYCAGRASWSMAAGAAVIILVGAFRAGRDQGGGIIDDIAILLCHGPIPLALTYYIQSREMNAAVLLAGLAPGLFAVGLAALGRLGCNPGGVSDTTVSRGLHPAATKYLFCLLTIPILPVVIYFLTNDHVYTLSATIVAAFSMPAIRRLFAAAPQVRGWTLGLLLAYGLLFSFGWLW